MELPDFKFEKKAAKKGFSFIAGVDEVGRGCFAGPVVAGCVIFSSDFIRENKSIEVVINDSKKMSSKQREISDNWIKRNCESWGIGQASVTTINKLGIKKATEMAFRKAIKDAAQRANKNIDYLLIDAFYAPYVRGLRRKNQNPIIKGDCKSISIAAASIIAKVYRDNLMVNLSQKHQFKVYNWIKNKGYGTKDHREAIQKYGSTRLHRLKFISTFLSK